MPDGRSIPFRVDIRGFPTGVRIIMKQFLSTKWSSLVKHTVEAWVDDYAPSMGAALSYYTVFSLAPMLLIVIAIAGPAVFGDEAARGEIFGQLRGLMGADAAKTIEDVLTSVSEPKEGVAATTIGIVLLLIGATSVFGELQDALSRILFTHTTRDRCRQASRPCARALALVRDDPRNRFSTDGFPRAGSSDR